MAKTIIKYVKNWDDRPFTSRDVFFGGKLIETIIYRKKPKRKRK